MKTKNQIKKENLHVKATSKINYMEKEISISCSDKVVLGCFLLHCCTALRQEACMNKAEGYINTAEFDYGTATLLRSAYDLLGFDF